MKFLQRLWAKPEPPLVLANRLFGPKSFEIEVTALRIKKLDVFWMATSNEWRRNEEDPVFYELQTDATLVSDVENRIPQSICVEIAGKVVGHMGHSDALQLHRRLKELGYGRIRSICQANVVGRTGYWKVNLDLDTGMSGAKPASSNACS